MKVYAEVPHRRVAVVLVRRVGVTTGFLFGLGMLALLLSGQASAEDRQRGGDAERSLLGAVTDVLSPVTDAVAPVVTPVTAVVSPVVDSVAPVTEPLVGSLSATLDPVLDPVLEPVLEPVPDPVLDPVSDAGSGAQRSELATGAAPDGSAPRLAPVPSEVTPSEAAVPADLPVWSGVRLVDSASARVAPVGLPAEPAPVVGSDRPRSPKVPVGPANGVGGIAGGGGSVGGSGGSHGADTAVSPPSGVSAADDRGGRGPPGTISWNPWVGYDQPECPS